MNRKQRREAIRRASKSRKTEMIETYADQGKDDSAIIFMYTFSLILKVLYDQWGWRHKRLNRLTNQLLDEYTKNNMSTTDLQKWLSDNLGIELSMDGIK